MNSKNSNFEKMSKRNQRNNSDEFGKIERFSNKGRKRVKSRLKQAA